MSDESTAFKNWINADVIKKYSNGLPVKSQNEFLKISKQLNELELRARVRLIANNLRMNLHSEFPKALKELLKITRSQNLSSFELWPATEFIQIYGLDHLDDSLEAMYELTQKFTAEFSIRPFINTHGDFVFKKLKQWHNDPNEHIRRWLSEGTRPRLPWGERLTTSVQDPRLGLEILESLKFDESLYVRKSVANHLNDIAKDHPDLVIKALKKWKKVLPEDFEIEFNFIQHRALRTLIKQGHPDALSLMGVRPNAGKVKIDSFSLKTKTVSQNSPLEFSFQLKNLSSKKEKFILDFVIYFQKANGDLSPKVFKLKTGFLEGSEQISINKKFSFKPITTRTYYSGLHRVALKLNGVEGPQSSFQLKL